GFPQLGVVGAAVAHAASKLLSVIWMMHIIFGRSFIIHLSFGKLWRIDHRMMMRIARIGLPSAGEQLALRIGQIVLTLVLAAQGTAVFAAHTICFNILLLSSVSGMAFSLAASTLVGQALGAKRMDLAVRYGKEAASIGNKISGAMGIVFITLAPFIMKLYASDPEVIANGTIALQIIGLVQIPQSSQYILAGALRGAGDTKFTLYSTLIGVTLVRALLCLTFVNGLQWGIAGAYLAIVTDQLVRTCLIFFRYNRGKWREIQV
ncbi:MAG: efflux family protein, partial [Paenibacillus sp.]|nr:efflux family protein [Paenibacillus sp.]